MTGIPRRLLQETDVKTSLKSSRELTRLSRKKLRLHSKKVTRELRKLKSSWQAKALKLSGCSRRLVEVKKWREESNQAA